jgi:hypothetical protein
MLTARSSIIPGTTILTSLQHHKPQEKINTTTKYWLSWTYKAEQSSSIKIGLLTITALHHSQD